MQPHKTVPVLYLDIDGTVRKGYDELGRFVNKVEDVEVFPEAIKQIKKAKDQGWRIVGISNQGGVALGHMDLKTLTATMNETNRQCDMLFDMISCCTHHPDAKDPEMAICWCRKPRIGLVVEAAGVLGRAHHETYPPHMAIFVGDMEDDRKCAENANIMFVDAKKWRAGGI